MTVFYSYDEIPYPDLCYGYTHPGRIAAIATLLNMQPAPVERCRVLELGCAGGGNLIPMAYGLPGSTFVGIDNSARQIEAAQARRAQFGLDNVTFHHMDIRELTPAFGQFDYIIVHGIYSWVPPDVKDHILAICQHNLAPQGVAYVSYNTLPGWHMVLIAREMMLYHTRGIESPRERARQARAFISEIADMVPDSHTSAYASFLRTYADIRFNKLAGHEAWEDAALLHDELSEINEPLYFHQFAAHAAGHGLQFLAEADFPQVMMFDLAEDAVDKVTAFSRDIVELQQYLDFVRHQTFRRTLLCHESISVDRTLRADRVQGLYAATRARLVSDEDGNEYFRAPDGSTFPADPPITRAALHYLSEISPRAVSFSALLKEACARLHPGEATDDEARTLALGLLQGFSFSLQLVELLAYDPPFAVQVSDRPRASSLALHQVQQAPLVSNLRHEQVQLEDLPLMVLPYLDGQHDRAALLDELLRLIETGRLAPPKEVGTDSQMIRKQLAHDLEYALRWLARAALLVG